MPFDAHKNFAYAAIATAPSPPTTGTTLTVASGQGARMPATPFNATLTNGTQPPDPTNSEVVRVTGVSGDVLTIARAQEGSTAMTVLAGWVVFAGITAKTLTDAESFTASGTSFPASPADSQQFWRTDAPYTGLYGWDATSGQWLYQGTGKAVPLCRLYRNAALSLSTASVVTFDTKSFDPSNIADVVTNQGRITPTRAGYYRISSYVRGPITTSSQYVIIYIRKNGAAVAVGAPGPSDSAISAIASVTDIVYANGTTDYFDIMLEHNLGGSQALTIGAQNTYMACEFVSNDYAGGTVTPKFRAHSTANGAAIASEAGAIQFPTQDWDDGGDNYNTATGRFTAPIAGKYHFDATLLAAGTYATTIQILPLFYKNGAAYSTGQSQRATNTADTDKISISDDIVLAAGDTVEVRVNISTGNFTAYGAASQYTSHFSGHLIPEPAGVIVPEGWHTFGVAGEPAFQNSWVDAAVGGATPGFHKDPFGLVRLRGQIKSGTLGAVAFTLPAGYRPVGAAEFIVQTNNTGAAVPGLIYVGANGDATMYVGNSVRVSLDSVQFKVN